MKAAKNKGGRPGRPRAPGERVPLGLRVTVDLKNKLDRASHDSGRSQSQEAELRLESSFRSCRIAIEALELAFGAETAKFMLRVGMMIRSASSAGNFITGTMHDDDLAAWLENPFVFAAVERGVKRLLEAQRPPGDPKFESQPGLSEMPDILELPPARREVGILAADRILSATGEGSPADWWISKLSGDPR